MKFYVVNFIRHLNNGDANGLQKLPEEHGSVQLYL